MIAVTHSQKPLIVPLGYFRKQNLHVPCWKTNQICIYRVFRQ
jgi:hypothetical protein